jgi:hypothetical protein
MRAGAGSGSFETVVAAQLRIGLVEMEKNLVGEAHDLLLTSGKEARMERLAQFQKYQSHLVGVDFNRDAEDSKWVCRAIQTRQLVAEVFLYRRVIRAQPASVPPREHPEWMLHRRVSRSNLNEEDSQKGEFFPVQVCTPKRELEKFDVD